ncbi:MAG: hypothetical protein U9Q27_01145 [Patescibacteria group bacterium]|nr:hypothetical protein [Patescibacteria group bacterium]
MSKIDILKKQYPKFVYQGYSYKIRKKRDNSFNLEIVFNFEIYAQNINKNLVFHPKIIIQNIDKKRLATIGERALNNFIFHIGLIEIPSYWKLTCSPVIEINTGFLDKNQIKFYKDLIINAMGQFFYENKINFTSQNFLKIICSNKNWSRPGLGQIGQGRASDKFLVLMGEGKDSIVSLELMKKYLKQNKLNINKNINCFIVNPGKEHFEILKIADIKNPIIIQRKIDNLLIKLNQQGFLNGHTPITAVISNLAIFSGALFGYCNIVLSCERSANQGNIEYLGKNINHQYSKSFEFEQNYKKYIKKYLIKDLNYFSFLRPLYEIQIAKIFSNFPKYFPVFLSCNEAKKTFSGTKKPIGKWCNNCSKCLFIFAILYPFLEKKQIIKIFKENLFEKKELLEIMKQLIGEKGTKPFECVGTINECIIAFYLSYKKEKENQQNNLPYLLEYFEKQILAKHKNLNKKALTLLNSWNKQNNLSKNLSKFLKKWK